MRTRKRLAGVDFLLIVSVMTLMNSRIDIISRKTEYISLTQHKNLLIQLNSSLQ